MIRSAMKDIHVEAGAWLRHRGIQPPRPQPKKSKRKEGKRSRSLKKRSIIWEIKTSEKLTTIGDPNCKLIVADHSTLWTYPPYFTIFASLEN